MAPLFDQATARQRLALHRRELFVRIGRLKRQHTSLTQADLTAVPL